MSIVDERDVLFCGYLRWSQEGNWFVHLFGNKSPLCLSLLRTNVMKRGKKYITQVRRNPLFAKSEKREIMAHTKKST